MSETAPSESRIAYMQDKQGAAQSHVTSDLVPFKCKRKFSNIWYYSAERRTRLHIIINQGRDRSKSTTGRHICSTLGSPSSLYFFVRECGSECPCDKERSKNRSRRRRRDVCGSVEEKEEGQGKREKERKGARATANRRVREKGR